MRPLQPYDWWMGPYARGIAIPATGDSDDSDVERPVGPQDLALSEIRIPELKRTTAERMVSRRVRLGSEVALAE